VCVCVCVWLKLSLSNIANGVGASCPCGLRKETSPFLESCNVFVSTDDDHCLGTQEYQEQYRLQTHLILFYNS
jgi:hypothetical protein